MTDGMWQMSRPDLEDRIAELEAENKIFRSDISGLEAAVNGLIAEKASLEAEKQKSAQEWLHLDAANRTLIEENKRLRDGASSNEVQRIWNAATQILTVDHINALSTRVLELRKEGFPCEEAKHG